MNKLDLKERIEQILKYKSLTISGLEVLIGMHNGYIGKYIRGDKKDLTFNTIELISSKFPDINPEWLITGTGDMLIDKKALGEAGGELTVSDLVRLSDSKLPDTGRSRPIPIYDIRASAGNTELILPQELTVDNTLHLPELKSCDFAVKAYGCSMEPLIMDGDLLACRKIHDRNRLQDGQIYLIGTSTNLYVKYLYSMSESLILTSENKTQKPIQIHPSEVLQVYEVVWAVRLTKL